MADAVALAEYLNEMSHMPEQVQDFYPTPGTASTCMYYTGLDPRTLKPVHIPDAEERAMQRALLQWQKKENRELVKKALEKCGRRDLIGPGKNCLISDDEVKPRPTKPPAKKPASQRGTYDAGGRVIWEKEASREFGGKQKSKKYQPKRKKK